MQQYFIDYQVKENDLIILNDDILYHLKKVLRKDSSYTFRIVDSNHDIYLANLYNDTACLIKEKLNEYNELDTKITCILSLIKSDKFELTLQKLVELGVNRIVPYAAYRSVLKIKDAKKLDRFRKIILEASEQSHRNIVPELCEVAKLKDLIKYKSDDNYICYESDKDIVDIKPSKSITYIIGPEGGFEDKEYQMICDMGYESISLGKRILRAETAAMYMTSVIVSKNQ